MGKLTNVRLLSQDRVIARHIPQSMTFSAKNLEHMLNKYPFVYIKPTILQQSKGILRIDNEKLYKLRTLNNEAVYYHLTTPSLISRINSLRWPTPYFIQQGINSLTRAGQPFDIRVHMLRVNKKWIIVGAVSRVAPLGQIVSTGCQGSRSYRLETLFTRQLNYSTSTAKTMAENLAKFSLKIAYAYEKFSPSRKEHGLDIGIDNRGHFWLYETNSKPASYVFRYVDDPVYYKILKLRKFAA